MKVKSTLLLILLSLSFSLLGQEKYNKVAINLDSTDFGGWYDAQLGSTSLFQVVGAYKPLSIPFPDSNPFFASIYSLKSDISYRGKTFKKVDLIYDQYQDMVFMVHPTLTAPMNLQAEHVAWFNMDGHLFKQIEGETGFFEILYEGTDLKLVKKNAQDVIGSQESLKYISENKYYVIRDGQLNRVTNKKSFTKLFPDKKDAINTYVKRNLRSTFKDNLDFSLTQLTKICDTKLNQ